MPTEVAAMWFENKMHPTKIAEQGWEDSYKLEKLMQA